MKQILFLLTAMIVLQGVLFAQGKKESREDPIKAGEEGVIEDD